MPLGKDTDAGAGADVMTFLSSKINHFYWQ